MRPALLVSILMQLSCGADPAGALPDRREPWADFPLGAWARYRIVRTAPDGAATFDERWTSVARDELSVRIRVELTLGNEPPTSYEHAIAVAVPLSRFSQRGVSDLDVAGRRLSCAVWERDEAPPTGARRRAKRWIAASIPWPVREEVEHAGAEGGPLSRRVTELREWETPQKVGEETLPCLLFETRVLEPELSETVLEWRCARVPGHLVREETTSPDGSRNSVQRLVEYSIPP